MADSDDSIDPQTVVGLLAEPARLRVLAAVALGASRLEDVAKAASVALPVALKAIERLQTGRLVDSGPDGYRINDEALTRSARTHAGKRPPAVPDHGDLPEDQMSVLRNFFVDGRLQSIPVARAKRVVVLDWLASRFDPGCTYPERDVNLILGMVHADYAALRRYLVDEGFLERRDGFYWRAGGSVTVD